MSGHLLSVVIFFPLLGVLAIVIGGREMGDRTARWLALFVTLVTFGVSLAVLGRFDHSDPGFQMVEQASCQLLVFFARLAELLQSERCEYPHVVKAG